MPMHRTSNNPAKPTHNQKRSKEKLEMCILHLAETGNVSETARRCGITPWLMYYWQRRSEDGYPGYTVDMGGYDDDGNPLVAEFHEAWDAALEMSADYLEQEAQRRAMDGFEELVIHKGVQAFVRDPTTGELELDAEGKPIPLTIRRYSDRMMEILLKARRPEKFRENVKIEAEVSGGVLAIPHSDQANLSADDWAARFRDNADGKTIDGTPVYSEEVNPKTTGREPSTGDTSVRALMEKRMLDMAENANPELEKRIGEVRRRVTEANMRQPRFAQSGPNAVEYGITDLGMTAEEMDDAGYDPLA